MRRTEWFSGVWMALALTVLLFILNPLFIAPAPAQAARELSQFDLQAYRKAFDAVDKRDWSRALALADKAKNPLPRKAIRWLYLQADGSGASFEEIRQFIDANPSWPRLEKLRERAEKALDDAVADRDIIAWFKQSAPLTGEGFLRYAEALERTGLTAMIAPAAIEAWRSLDMSAADENTFRKLYRKLVPMADEIRRLDRLIWERKWSAAKRQAKRVPDGYRQLADARMRLARRAGGVDAAIERVPPNLQKNPGLIYERMRWRRRKGLDSGAIELLAWPDMQAGYPEKWWRERAILARDQLEAGNPEIAYQIASQHRVPRGAGFAAAEWFSGWVALRALNDPVKAFPHFRDMYNNVGYPVSKSRAAYWAGRAAEAGQQPDIAGQWYSVAAQYKTSFYGQLAAGKLRAQSAPSPVMDVMVSSDRRAIFAQKELPNLIIALSQIGADDTVRTLVRHMASTYRDPAFLGLIAGLATQINRLDLAVYASRQAIKENVITLDGFPVLPFQSSQIEDLAIVHGLIRQESGFDIDAISSAGARGLMQLMPATARAVSGWEKVRYRSAQLTADPDYNVRLGSAYLEDLLDQFDGVLPMAFAGYNAGPHRVNQWIKRFGDPREMSDEEIIDWMEMIPFRETRNYVQRVLENIAVYRQMANRRFAPIRFHLDHMQ